MWVGMRRIDKRTVQLTVEEMAIKDLFDSKLDEGATIKDAAIWALSTYCVEHPEYARRLEGAFVRYISDGTLRWRPQSTTLIVDQ